MDRSAAPARPRCMDRNPLIARALAAALCLAMVGEPAVAASARQRGSATPLQPRTRPAPALPTAVAAILRESGLPTASFGLAVRAVESGESAPLLALNAERPFLLASTTKLVTSLAALDLLGPQHSWRTTAHATGPVVAGLSGRSGHRRRRHRPDRQRAAALVRADARRRAADGDRQHRPRQCRPAARARSETGTNHRARAGRRDADRRTHLQPRQAARLGPAGGRRASGHATATARQRAGRQRRPDGRRLCRLGALEERRRDRDRAAAAALGAQPLEHRVRQGRHRLRSAAARVQLAPELGAAPAMPIAAPRMVAELWAAAGGSLRGKVVESDASVPASRARRWSSELATPVVEVLREMNKTSNNEAAHGVLLALASGAAGRGGALKAAQDASRPGCEPRAWPTATSRWSKARPVAERGRPRAFVDLLCSAWRGPNSQALVDSLPIAGVDGTLVHRMTRGAAAGQAYLKTGTRSDTRALAGMARPQRQGLRRLVHRHRSGSRKGNAGP
ncbi:MAG: D-alanyl-D-alanine carboxypeptidase [Variovorax sp.]